MRYAGIIKDDFVNGEDVCVSFWAQGCKFHCKGCHNPQTWDFSGGSDADPDDLIQEVLKDITANGIQRNLSLLGGEPLCEENRGFIRDLVKAVKMKFPKTKIFIWTGYTFNDLMVQSEHDKNLKDIINESYMLATGPFIKELRDVSLKWVGSSNQEVKFKGKDY